MSETVTTAAPSAASTGGSSTSSQGSASAAGQSQSTTHTHQAQGQGSAAAAGASSDPNAFKDTKSPVVAPSEPAAPRKLGATDMDALVEVKIDGNVQEISLKEAIKLSQLERASRQKISEAQKSQQEAMRLMQLAKSDPERYMKEVMGVDPKAWAEERLAKEYELQQMSPEARRAMELEQEVNRFKTQDQKSKEPLLNELKNYMTEIPEGAENATREEIERFVQHKRAEFQAGQQALEQELIQAWEQGGLPKEKDFGVWMAQEMIAHKKRTRQDLAPAEAAGKVKARFVKSTKSILGKMDAQAIQDLLGNEIIEKLRAHDVERVSKPQTPPWASVGEQTSPQQGTAKKYMNEIEYRQWLKS